MPDSDVDTAGHAHRQNAGADAGFLEVLPTNVGRLVASEEAPIERYEASAGGSYAGAAMGQRKQAMLHRPCFQSLSGREQPAQQGERRFEPGLLRNALGRIGHQAFSCR